MALASILLWSSLGVVVHFHSPKPRDTDFKNLIFALGGKNGYR